MKLKALSILLLLSGCTSLQQNPTSTYLPLSWENTTQPHPERAPWSAALSSLVDANLTDFSKASDITQFCPKYVSLTKTQQIKAVSELIVGVIYYESGYSPVSRMVETTLGTDPVTGRAVESEGLLQLSYQDQQWATFCKFNWPADKLLSATDPKKTILDPYINLACGVKIMSNQVKNKGAFTISSNYWSTLKAGGKYGQVGPIVTKVKNNTGFCN